ncbi:hypothetical protein MRB53_041687 [Persea americana]|nr:hypothetical protein MRB53_041687 [Persea americana]
MFATHQRDDRLSRRCSSSLVLSCSGDAAEYQSTKEADLTALDKQLHIALAQSQRLVSLSRGCSSVLAECLRSEDKTSFANLRNVFQEGCRNVLASSNTVSVRPSNGQYQEDGFLDRIPSQSRDSILTLLTRLRYDEAFVATQFTNLSHKHLTMLLPDSSSKGVFSVLENVNTSQKGPSPLGFAIDRLMEDIAGNASSSPLDTIIRLAHGDMFLRKESTQLATRVWVHCMCTIDSGRKDW